MKFGKTFPNHQVPEWSHEYVNYKSLKKLIKEIVAVQDQLYKQEPVSYTHLDVYKRQVFDTVDGKN